MFLYFRKQWEIGRENKIFYALLKLFCRWKSTSDLHLGSILTLSYCLKVTRFWNGITDQWWMYHLNKSGVLLLIRQRKSTSLFVIILPGKNKLNDFELMGRYESFRVLFEALLSPHVRDFGFRNPGNFALGIWLIGEIFACGIKDRKSVV